VGDLALTAGVVSYVYLNSGAPADVEVSLRGSYDTHLSPSLAVNYGLDGGITKNLYYEAGIAQGLPELELGDIAVNTSLGADMGYSDPDKGKGGLSHYQLSFNEVADIGFMELGVSLLFIDNINTDVLPEFAGAYDTKFVIVVSANKGF